MDNEHEMRDENLPEIYVNEGMAKESPDLGYDLCDTVIIDPSELSEYIDDYTADVNGDISNLLRHAPKPRNQSFSSIAPNRGYKNPAGRISDDSNVQIKSEPDCNYRKTPFMVSVSDASFVPLDGKEGIRYNVDMSNLVKNGSAYRNATKRTKDKLADMVSSNGGNNDGGSNNVVANDGSSYSGLAVQDSINKPPVLVNVDENGEKKLPGTDVYDGEKVNFKFSNGRNGGNIPGYKGNAVVVSFPKDFSHSISDVVKLMNFYAKDQRENQDDNSRGGLYEQ